LEASPGRHPRCVRARTGVSICYAEKLSAVGVDLSLGALCRLGDLDRLRAVVGDEVRDHLRDASGQFGRRRQVEEFVRSVRVRAGTEHASDEELGVGELSPEHTHERDGAAFTPPHRRLSEERERSVDHALFEPGSEGRSVVAGSRLVDVERDQGTEGRVFLQHLLELETRHVRIVGGRDSEGQSEGGVRTQDVSRIGERGKPFSADDSEGRLPGAREEKYGLRPTAGVRTHDPGELVVHVVAEHTRGTPDLHIPVVRNHAVKQLQRTRGGILDAVEELTGDHEAVRHDARRSSRVHTLREDVHPEVAVDDTTEGVGHPEPIVVAGPGVEADHQIRSADLLGIRREVSGQITTPAFLVRLDEDDDPRKRESLSSQDLESGDGCEGRIPVVSETATVELVALEHGVPCGQPFSPAVEWRLLVEMSVEEYRPGSFPREFHEDDGSTIVALLVLERELLDRETENGLRVRPVHEELDGAIHVTVFLPLRIEVRRHVLSPSELAERQKDRVLPDTLGGLECTFGVQFVSPLYRELIISRMV